MVVFDRTTGQIVVNDNPSTRYDGESVVKLLIAVAAPDAAGDRPWAVKQGWGCCSPDRVLHTTGIVGDRQRYIVAALSSHDRPTTWEQVTGELTEAVRVALDALGR